ncbi:OmpP1/FadL family transporter [Sinorhizobium sp. BG8]|uniref:OmpP1/FadL family transporter n=1 Tax=Sinorhizobium sp. BG8 TaxID=2613773 RepID=UPI00193D0A23|nr:OmpP1/FadL family transporter [Sinorhizobium sp. BG8]QRM56922.1 transporter [Sinorhizobium sp. BG8]
MKKLASGTGALALAVASFSTPVMAGGLEREGYNIDLLFEQSPFAVDSSVTYVLPDRKLKNAKDTKPSPYYGTLNDLGYTSTADESANFAVPRLAAKAAIGDAVDCMVSYSEPWGAHSNPGPNWAGAKSMIEIEVFSRNYDGTCSYKFDAGPGQLRVIGGVFYQEVGGSKEALVVPQVVLGSLGLPGTGLGRLEGLEGNGVGWRAGVSYEIEEYALRTSLVYNSQVDLGDIEGTLDLTDVPSAVDPTNSLLGNNTPVYGRATMPESLELAVQTGIAPDWLAFGSVKWTNWSILQTVTFCPTATRGVVSCSTGSPADATSLDLLYRDGWTITGGVGHKLDDQWSVGASLTWDRGTSTGVGTQTDVWSVGLGSSYKPTENVEFRLAGALGLMTSGSSSAVTTDEGVFGDDVSYDFGNDWVSAFSATLKVKF